MGMKLRVGVKHVLSQAEIVARASTHQGEWEVCNGVRPLPTRRLDADG